MAASGSSCGHQVKGRLPVLVVSCLQGVSPAPLCPLHHLLLQGLPALRLRVGQQSQPLGVAPRELRLLGEIEEEKRAESEAGPRPKHVM